MATGFVCDERYFWWDTRSAGLFMPSHHAIGVEPDVHAESAATKRRFRNLLDLTGLIKQLEPVEPRMATVEEVARCHSSEHIERMKALSDDNGGDAGELTPFAPGGYEIALLAAGGVMAAVDAVVSGSVRNAYALVRPPGHHAERDRGRGFCMFANCTIAARHAQAGAGAEARRDRRLGRPPRQRHAVADLRRPVGPGRSRCTRTSNFPPDSGYVRRTARVPAWARTSTCRCRPARASAPTWRRSSAS